MRHWFSVALGACIVGCHTASPSAKTDLEAVQGDWVLASFHDKTNEKATLQLKGDYTFSADFMEKGKSNKISGKYAVSHASVQNHDMTMIDFTSQSRKSKENPTGLIMRLIYDRNMDVLYDLTVLFSRPGQEQDVRNRMEKLRAESAK